MKISIATLFVQQAYFGRLWHEKKEKKNRGIQKHTDSFSSVLLLTAFEVLQGQERNDTVG